MFHPVKEPSHYAGDGEVSCMRALKSMMWGASLELELPSMVIYWWGCAFKYLWRWPWKNGKQDVEKCIQCLNYLMDELEGEGNGSVSGDQG